MVAKAYIIKDLDFDKELWLNELSYLKKEIELHNHKLEDVVTRTSDRDLLRHVEHFQNQFIRHIEVIDELRHDVKAHENVLETFEGKEEASEGVLEGHMGLTKQMSKFREIYQELKDKFHQFIDEKL